MAILASSAVRSPIIRLNFLRTYLTMASLKLAPAMLQELATAMPFKEMTAMSVAPSPMSTIMVPWGTAMSTPAPMAAATGSSMRQTFRTPAAVMASTTARFSTSVTLQGTLTTTRGMNTRLELICFK